MMAGVWSLGVLGHGGRLKVQGQQFDKGMAGGKKTVTELQWEGRSGGTRPARRRLRTTSGICGSWLGGSGEVSGGVRGGASSLVGLKGPTGIFERRDG